MWRKLGAKEMVGKREVYQVQNKAFGDLCEVSVWIDTEMQLLLRRLMAEKQKGKRIRTTETYGMFTMDSKLDGKLFVVRPR